MVVHVLPLDLPRGAQAYARALCDALGPGQLALTLFESPPAALRPEVALGVPPRRLRRAGFDPRAAMRLRRALRERQPAVVVAHGGEALKYAAPARPAGTPLVYVKIGLTRGRLRSRLQLELLRAAARRAEAVVAVSEEMAGEARELLRIPADRVHLIPNGRDPAVYRPGERRRGNGPVRLAFVGYLDRAKRPELFCEMVRALRGQGARVEGVVAGDGPLLRSLRPVAQAAGVELLGPREDVPEVLGASDALVFTGEQYEGMPGVLIEAGLCGLPAVTTDVPGAAAVVEDGVTGFVVGRHDREGLVECTARVASDTALRERMGSAARERCVERFAIHAGAARWRALIDRLAGRPSGAAAERAVEEPLGIE